MKRGILEVLLVSAEGIIHTNVIGKPKYYVNIECGTQMLKSKTSKGNHEEICWNEKFTFELPSSQPENPSHLKLKIMDEEYFTDGGFVGQTTICLKGILIEGDDKQAIEVRPAPYNVVLEDDTYKGQIKIGLKFIPNVQGVLQRERGDVAEANEFGQSICWTISNILQIPYRYFFKYWNTSSIDKHKPN